MAPSTPYGTLFIVAVLFATSGAAGLTYEVVWQKQLSQILGSNVTASVVVLSGFMAGLAAGSQFLGARLAARPRPIRTYGVVEIVIACLALATPRAFAVLAEVRYEFLAAVGCPDALGHALLTLGVLITVLVPTILMGATLPLLSDVVHDRLGVRGGTMALLYGSNTMGGVVGALGAGVFGVPALGLTRTLTWMVGLNLAVGLVAWMLDAVLVTGGGTAPARVPPSGTPAIGADGNGPSSGAPDRIIQAVFLIGFVAMGYETVLLRLLPFVFGSSTLAFSLMLAAFIAGIAIGSFLAPFLIRRGWTGTGILGSTQMIGSLSFMLALAAMNLLPLVMIKVKFVLASGVYVLLAAQAVFIFGIMCVPAIFLGIFLPLAIESSGRDLRLSDAIARLYSRNTLGNILGTIMTGLVAFPVLGVQGTARGLAGIQLLAGAWLAYPAVKARHRQLLAVAMGAGMGVILLAPDLDFRILSSQVYRMRQEPDVPLGGLWAWLAKGREVLMTREDATATVTVESYGDGKFRSLRVNGRVEASTSSDLPTQKLLAHLPLLAHANPKRVAIVGLGSGITAESVLKHPVDDLLVVELSSGVVEASRFFIADPAAFHADPRLTIRIDDARRFLSSHASRYDVLISEPSNPWVAGITNLYSQEFFELIRRRLTPGGVLGQWIQAYETSQETLALILRTMHQVFPYLEVFRVARSDLLILAGEQRPKLNLDRVSWALRTEPIRTDLASVDVHDPLHIAIHHLVASTELYRLTPFGPINLDDHPILEYRAPLELFGASDVDLSQWFYRCHSDQYLLKVYRAAIDPDVERWHSVLAYGRKELDPRIIRAELEAILDKSPAFLPALIDLANDALQNRDLHHAQTLIDRALVIDSASAAAQLLAFRVAVAIERDRQPLDGLRAFVESRRHLETLIYLEPEDLSHYLDLLPLALHAGDHSRVRSLIQEIHSRFGAGDLQAMTRVYLVTVQGALAFEEGNLAAGRQLLESASGQIDQMDAPMRKFYSQTWSDLTRSPASIAQP